MVNPIILPTRMRGLSSLMGLTLIASCSLGEIWELLGNYPVFIAVMVIYHCIERVWGIVVTLNFCITYTTMKNIIQVIQLI